MSDLIVLPPHRILLVEDEQDLRLLLAIRFKTLGFNIETTEYGTTAVRLVSASAGSGNAFTHLILDCAIPYFDGLSVAKEVRQNESIRPDLPPVKIAFHSAVPKDSAGMEHAMRDLQTKCYWTKPQDTIRLDQLVREWIMKGECFD